MPLHLPIKKFLPKPSFIRQATNEWEDAMNFQRHSSKLKIIHFANTVQCIPRSSTPAYGHTNDMEQQIIMINDQDENDLPDDAKFPASGDQEFFLHENDYHSKMVLRSPPPPSSSGVSPVVFYQNDTENNMTPFSTMVRRAEMYLSKEYASSETRFTPLSSSSSENTKLHITAEDDAPILGSDGSHKATPIIIVDPVISESKPITVSTFAAGYGQNKENAENVQLHLSKAVSGTLAETEFAHSHQGTSDILKKLQDDAAWVGLIDATEMSGSVNPFADNAPLPIEELVQNKPKNHKRTDDTAEKAEGLFEEKQPNLVNVTKCEQQQERQSQDPLPQIYRPEKFHKEDTVFDDSSQIQKEKLPVPLTFKAKRCSPPFSFLYLRNRLDKLAEFPRKHFNLFRVFGRNIRTKKR